MSEEFRCPHIETCPNVLQACESKVAAELADQNGLHPDELRGRDLKTAISIIVRRGVSR